MTYGLLLMPHSKLKNSSWIQPVSVQALWPDLQGLLLIACPGCRRYYRYRVPHRRATLVPQSSGRRRTICGHCGNALKSGIQQ